jgi:hypothetical protein
VNLINESKSCGIEGPIPMRADKSAFGGKADQATATPSCWLLTLAV